jgi:hypothetical protein
MPVVNQEIPNLLGGVSQQPATLRDVTEGDEQINMVSFQATGAAKRPASDHSAVLSATPSAAYDSVHMHSVARNSTDRFRIVLSNGDLKVFDAATGAEQTVTFPNGKAYLNTTDPARDLRCVTVGEYTYITNKTVVVARASTKSPDAKEEALVVVRAADFATKYTVTIDSTTVEYITPDGDNPRARADIGTEKIAGKLRDLLVAAFPLFSFTQYGSTLYIKRANEAAFAISASDGLADQGILAIKGSVQRFDELPDRAKNGFIVEVTGDAQNKFDNYYVKYNDNGTPSLAGVWEETVKPGVLTSLNAATMPHQLVRGAALFADIKAESIAALPTIGLGPETTLTDNWDHRAALDLSGQLQNAVLDEETEEVNACLGALDGTTAKVRAYFDVTAGLIKSGHYITMEMYLSNAPSLTPVPFAPRRLHAGRITRLPERRGVVRRVSGVYDHEAREHSRAGHAPLLGCNHTVCRVPRLRWLSRQQDGPQAHRDCEVNCTRSAVRPERSVPDIVHHHADCRRGKLCSHIHVRRDRSTSSSRASSTRWRSIRGNCQRRHHHYHSEWQRCAGMLGRLHVQQQHRALQPRPEPDC